MRAGNMRTHAVVFAPRKLQVLQVRAAQTVQVQENNNRNHQQTPLPPPHRLNAVQFTTCHQPVLTSARPA